ncbi:MAG: outer membrane beta-barrel protein [Candidatus Methylacidiphilales bacterium]
MNKWIAGLFATVLVAGIARADVGAPAPSAKDLEKVVEAVNYVETAKSGIVLSGYVDVGYVYNFSGALRGAGDAKQLRAPSDQTPKGDFSVNAVKITLEKPLTDANEFQAGFRVDLMTGEDASNTLGGSNSLGVAGESNGLLLEQAYVAVRAPLGNGLDIKAGKFVTWLGYEVIERPANLNITYGNLFQNAIPLYHTGISAEYAFNDIVDAGIAVVNGFNNDTTPAGAGRDEDGYGIMAKINFTNPGQNANWFHALYYGFGNNNTGADDEQTLIYDTWGNWAPTAFNDKLLLGINANIGHADTGSATQDTATWWGVALYAKYQFTDIFSLAGRADYLHSDEELGSGFNTFTGSANGSHDQWSYTLTAGFDLLENLLVRAEYRVDVAETGGSDSSHTVALQAVYTF